MTTNQLRNEIQGLAWDFGDPYGANPITIGHIQIALGGNISLQTIIDVLDSAAVRAGLNGE